MNWSELKYFILLFQPLTNCTKTYKLSPMIRKDHRLIQKLVHCCLIDKLLYFLTYLNANDHLLFCRLPL